MKSELLGYIKQALELNPQVSIYLSDETKAALSSADYKNEIMALIILLYYYKIDAIGFNVGMNTLISKYIFAAYVTAWEQNGTGGSMPPELMRAYNDAVMAQKGFVQGLYEDVLAARASGKPLSSLLSRAELWGTHYTQEHNNALGLIATIIAALSRLLSGQPATPTEPPAPPVINMVWHEGDTMEKCDVCMALDGIVAPVELWRELHVTPQNAPNDKLTCGGWRCQCTLVMTNEPATPDARGMIMRAVL